MPDASQRPVEVLSGEVLSGEHQGLRWRVTTGTGDMMTWLEVFRGDQLMKSSGFGGSPLPLGTVVDEWRGRSDGTPHLVVARVHPDVDRVVATTDRGTEVVLDLSPVFPQFGLRFAATALPEGEGPGGLRAESSGRVVTAVATPVPPSR